MQRPERIQTLFRVFGTTQSCHAPPLIGRDITSYVTSTFILQKKWKQDLDSFSYFMKPKNLKRKQIIRPHEGSLQKIATRIRVRNGFQTTT